MEQSKWKEFENPAHYRLVDMGRPAFFLIPVKKLKMKLDGEAWEKRLHKFLVLHFSAYTSALVPSYGIWTDTGRKIVLDECRQYTVSFLGKERIPLLLGELASIATFTGEECIYFEAGQYACLIYPPH